jgi:ribosomal protein S26
MLYSIISILKIMIFRLKFNLKTQDICCVCVLYFKLLAIKSSQTKKIRKRHYRKFTQK